MAVGVVPRGMGLVGKNEGGRNVTGPEERGGSWNKGVGKGGFGKSVGVEKAAMGGGHSGTGMDFALAFGQGAGK